MNKKIIAIALAAGAVTIGTGVAIAADGPAITTKSGTLGQPAAGMGQVVFFRPGSIMGAALGCTVHEDDKEIARLGSGKYHVVSATPGKHLYFTKGEATDKLNLEVETGETYFVRCNIGAGIMAGRANLSPSDQATFAKKAKGLTLWAGKKDDKDDKKGDK
ncbi:DUF2846 domain-containing protein [Sphingomonas sp.]|uniref:DUF2846 domain-containing protein n=1 Tax=Sphingomonas sp. TaxID=28214 RepID=UPI0025DA2A5F|nr:DUF2846 domain-containing protein [Sphingomonas sp.]